MGLADIRVLLALNHPLAAHRLFYEAALLVTDKGADVVFLLTVAWHVRSAEQLAEQTEGVKEVVNNLKVSPS